MADHNVVLAAGRWFDVLLVLLGLGGGGLM